MKTYILWITGVVFVLVVILAVSTEAFNVLSDLSSVMFFMFALVNIIIIGTIIAVEIAKNLKLEIVQKELDALEQERYYIENNDELSILFSKEAIELQQTLHAVQKKIAILQESCYEHL